jgi:hypothetical protein
MPYLRQEKSIDGTARSVSTDYTLLYLPNDNSAAPFFGPLVVLADSFFLVILY